MSTIIDKIEQEQLKDTTPDFQVGDSVKVHCLVKEGDKERTQLFAGLVIARRGSGVNASCLLYTSPSPRDLSTSRMPSSA